MSFPRGKFILSFFPSSPLSFSHPKLSLHPTPHQTHIPFSPSNSIVRASLGAMSTTQDVDVFLAFLRENFLLEKGLLPAKKKANANVKVKRQNHLLDTISSAAVAAVSMTTVTAARGDRTVTGTGTQNTVILPPSPTPTFGEEGVPVVVMKPKMLERIGSAISV